MKRLIALLLTCSMLLCGCGTNQTEANQQSSQEMAIKEEIEGGNWDEPNDEALADGFVNLSDSDLLQHVEDSIYADLVNRFNSEDYIIEDVNAIYVSQEYLEELEYNAQSNIYFGYTLSEIEEQFEGAKYVFTLSDDGKTVVEEFENYSDTYGQVIKNVAIGTGVILICVTVSVISGGAGAPAVSMIFAASAKTGTAFALSSGVLSAVAAGTITGVQTKDFEQALNAAALEGSEGFKWGALTGVITGGVSKAITIRKASEAVNGIPTPRDSELYALKKYGGNEQLTYLGGEEVKFGTQNATRPDVVRTVKGKIEAIEVKNYNLESSGSRSTLYSELKRQVTARVNNLPEGSTQRIVLDTRGRNYSQELITHVTSHISSTCGDVYPNIPIDILR